jgi:hypothetical protein
MENTELIDILGWGEDSRHQLKESSISLLNPGLSGYVRHS